MTTDRVAEVVALADTLWFLPPPGRRMIADKLYGLGVRIFPELATLQLEREGPTTMGAHRPSRVVNKTSMAEGMDILRQVNPEMAARIDAARTDEEKAAVDADFGLREKFPDAVQTLIKHTGPPTP